MQHCDCLEDSHWSNSLMDLFGEPRCSNARAWAWSRQGKEPAGDRCWVQDGVVRVRGGAQPREGGASSCVMAGDLPLFGDSMVKCCSICNWALEAIEVRGWEKRGWTPAVPLWRGKSGQGARWHRCRARKSALRWGQRGHGKEAGKSVPELKSGSVPSESSRGKGLERGWGQRAVIPRSSCCGGVCAVPPALWLERSRSSPPELLPHFSGSF